MFPGPPGNPRFREPLHHGREGWAILESTPHVCVPVLPREPPQEGITGAWAHPVIVPAMPAPSSCHRNRPVLGPRVCAEVLCLG